jgi:hypothetical protein
MDSTLARRARSLNVLLQPGLPRAARSLRCDWDGQRLHGSGERRAARDAPRVRGGQHGVRRRLRRHAEHDGMLVPGADHVVRDVVRERRADDQRVQRRGRVQRGFVRAVPGGLHVRRAIDVRELVHVVDRVRDRVHGHGERMPPCGRQHLLGRWRELGRQHWGCDELWALRVGRRRVPNELRDHGGVRSAERVQRDGRVQLADGERHGELGRLRNRVGPRREQASRSVGDRSRGVRVREATRAPGSPLKCESAKLGAVRK